MALFFGDQSRYHPPMLRVCLATLCFTLFAEAASAQYLPNRNDVPAQWILGVNGNTYIPIDSGTLCPSSYQCVLGGGFGFGVDVERRENFGLGLLMHYGATFLDAGSVFELTVLHRFGFGLRFTPNLQERLRPSLDAIVAFAIFGDPSPPSTVGGTLTVSGGAELDLYRSVTLFARVSAQALSLVPFSTLDGAHRAAEFGVAFGASLMVGIQVSLTDPADVFEN